MEVKNPYIIIGMHRSGTSLLAKVLEKGGVFMGVIKDHNYEAMHFLSLNQQILWGAGGNWLEPVIPEKKHWKALPPKELYHEHFKLNGRLQRLRYSLFPQPWGWKDPRNTFTLPMWLELFPQARVIHLLRDREAVALSLKKRNNVPGEVHDPRLSDLDFNRELWEKYVHQGKSYSTLLGKNYLEIEYYDLIHKKAATVKKLEEFTHLQLRNIIKAYART